MNPMSEYVLRDFMQRHYGRDMTDQAIADHLQCHADDVRHMAKVFGLKAATAPTAVHTPHDGFAIAVGVKRANKFED